MPSHDGSPRKKANNKPMKRAVGQVIAALKNTRNIRAEGPTMMDIFKFINTSVEQPATKKQIATALKRGVEFGILKAHKGHYQIQHIDDYPSPAGMDPKRATKMMRMAHNRVHKRYIKSPSRSPSRRSSRSPSFYPNNGRAKVGTSPEAEPVDNNSVVVVGSRSDEELSETDERLDSSDIPDFPHFTKHVEQLYKMCRANTNGKVATYIPQLAQANPQWWGVSVCTTDGHRYSIGDTDVPFTLQSCCKPLTYAIALESLGCDKVHEYVGLEPSGRIFNELVLDNKKKPHNPMVNAGAIMICSLLQMLVEPQMTMAEKFDYTMNYIRRLAGGERLGFNNAVWLSERETGNRNYALGFYMKEHDCYPDNTNLSEVMDFYFQCCSMEGTTELMAVLAATLANGGVCPTTQEKILNSESVKDVLSLMHSCGMYDYSGQFAFKVGIPAKSGVSGGMMIVIPNVMGISTFSPPLDCLGNSCRGLQFCEELVKQFKFHMYDNLKPATPTTPATRLGNVPGDSNKPKRKPPTPREDKRRSVMGLLFSAASGDVDDMRRLMKSGVDMTMADYDGRTALHLTAAEGHVACVEFLIEECGVPHDPKDRWGNRPVDEATTFGHSEVVEYLKTVEANRQSRELLPLCMRSGSCEKSDGEEKSNELTNGGNPGSFDRFAVQGCESSSRGAGAGPSKQPRTPGSVLRT